MSLSENNFTILPFTEDNFALSLSNKFIQSELIKSKVHFIYLLDYLTSTEDGFNTKAILVENKYVSKSFISDYSDYYSKCFKEYERITKRIHFFSNIFTEEEFLEVLSDSKENKEFWDTYLGFIVAKPLPDAIIGPTLLKTFNRTETDKRNYTVVKNYDVHLFGKTLRIDSLIYQEQDSVLSACATTALWSAFQKTSDLFHSLQPSPSEITKMAGNLFFNSGRTFPNHGLDNYQICKAIEEVGLVSELRNQKTVFEDINFFKAFVYSYLKMGLPVLLGIEFENMGLHLITLTGYKENISSFINSPNLSLKAFQIERFYAHDDQVGPFCRIGFDGNEIETSWWNNNISEKLKAKISAVFIPLYPKIRITFEEIYTKINIIDKLLYLIKISGVEIVWDIFLDYSNTFKKEMRTKDQLEMDLKNNLLTNSMPRFIWRAEAFVNNSLEMELIFDATDISRGFFCTHVIFFNVDFKEALRPFFELEDFRNEFIELLGKNYFDLFMNELKNH